MRTGRGSANAEGHDEHRTWWPCGVAAVLGAAYFAVIAGWPVLTPTSIDWVMSSDWRIHFLGWHLFRDEPWTWPPGRLLGYNAPEGTAIGFTDSLPLVALSLKPFSALLPQPLQYLGPWMATCFALQGFWGARLAALWTTSGAAQVLMGVLLVLLPTLLNRAPHPALMSHWLLLWAIWLYFSPGPRLPTRSIVVLSAVAGLIHPYLAVMVLALIAAVVVNAVVEREDDSPPATRHPSRRRAARPLATLAVAVALTAGGWWASGLFTATEASMIRPGLTRYSMNLLGPVMPGGWSAWLPEIPVASDGQLFEGLQYFGTGALLLVAAGLGLAGAAGAANATPASPDAPVPRRARFAARIPVASITPSPRLWPMAAACGLLAVYALSPRVTLADRVVVDYSAPWLEPLAVFGVTGRFFWPAAYLVLALAARSVLRRLSSAAAAAILLTAVVVQAVDTRAGYRQRYELTRSALFHHFPGKPQSPVWAEALPHYQHLVMVMPAQCAATPLSFEVAGYLAGLHGLTMNGGEMARPNEAGRVRQCRALEDMVTTGTVDHRTVYLVDPSREAGLRAAAPSLVCGTVDGLRVCVTRASASVWSPAALD